MPLVILHHLLNVFVQLANKRGFKQKKSREYLEKLSTRSISSFTCGDSDERQHNLMQDSLQSYQLALGIPLQALTLILVRQREHTRGSVPALLVFVGEVMAGQKGVCLEHVSFQTEASLRNFQ
jgi:hypothetical protein